MPFRTVTWNLASLAEDSLEASLSCARMTMLSCRKRSVSSKNYHRRGATFLLAELFQGNGMAVGGVQSSLCRIESVTIDGWQIKCGHQTSADQLSLANDQSSLEDNNVQLHEIEQIV